jgi:fido (protein-threonine AMPylation protein)
MATSGHGLADGDSARSTSGVAPERIAIELRTALENIGYRWEHTADWTPRELGIVAHAEAVRIHPFTDGNGRTTRLLADLVFITAQDPAEFQYNWDVDKRRYIELLRDFDQNRDVTDLAAFIGIEPIEE